MAETKKTEVAAKSAAAEKPKQPPPAARKKFGGRAIILALVLLAAVGGGGYLSWPHLYPKLRQIVPKLPPIEDARVGGLADRLKALEVQVATPVKDAEIARMEAEREKLTGAVSRLLDRVKSLEDAIGSVKEMAKAAATAEEAARASADLKRLNERLTRFESSSGEPATMSAEFEKRIAEAETRAADRAKSVEARVGEAIVAIERRVESIATAPPPSSVPMSNRRSATALAVAQLQRSAESGRPYLSDLQNLTAILGDASDLQPQLTALAASAATGIPTIDALRREFDALAGELAVKAGGDGGDGWVARAVARLSSLVRVRRVDGKGDPGAPDTIIANAEARLAAGDLGAAVAAVERLAATPLAAAETWLARAKARLAAAKALNALHVSAVSALSAPAKE